MARPGISVTEAPLPRVVANSAPGASLGAFIGTALRGPTTPTLVTSWSDFIAQFGSFSTGITLPDALYQFFNNGGGQAYVTRVLASDAVAATATFNDGADRLTFTAITKGVWGNGLDVDVSLEGGADDQFTITVKEDIRGVSVAVERFVNVSMDTTSARYVESLVNSPTIGSKYISVGDVVKDDGNLGAGGSVALDSGSDGVAAVGSSEYAAALDLYDELEGNFVFNAPGLDQTEVADLVTKIETERGDSILICDTAENLDVATLLAGSLPTGSYAALYYPWIYIADPAPDAPRGSIKKVPPGASVVGMILRTDASRGTFKAPAGVTATLSGAVANELRLTNTELDDLAHENINVVRPMPGAGIAAMGARTRLKGDTSQYISVRRTLNFIKTRAVEVSRFALFEPNTPALWEQLRVANGAFLSELWQIGGLAGIEFAEAFYVKCDEENNTELSISNGEVHVEIGVAPVFPAEFVVIKVGQFEADASVVVTEEG